MLTTYTPDAATSSLSWALRRLIASKQKDAMIAGIAGLTDLEAGLDAPAVTPEP
ncbi:hypothetical protein [uncultured Microbacterium sp.]|uniref:hypothetical protein n=1 Tax=uncultured Microbacterium sp. TaxID=191216 RepID=UPI0025D09812|nr:hypothetical protein [uncultured Microbacterium sp.]